MITLTICGTSEKLFYLRCNQLSHTVLCTVINSGLGRRTFSVAGPLVWNSIADCLRDPALELASFKRQLKTFLFARY